MRTLGANSAAPETSSHVYDAQMSLPGDPGAYYPSQGITGNALTRTTDMNLRNLNRNTAVARCSAEGITDSCDEYPFASTYEGAASQPGTSHYSVRGVPGPDNDNQGGLVSTFYGSSAANGYRVLEGDSFYVQVQ